MENFQPSTIENMDAAIYHWINDELNIFCNTIDGWEKVSVNFSSPERSWSSKSDKDARLNDSLLKYPLISITRKGFKKPKQKSGILQGSAFAPNSTRITIPIKSDINHDKTSHRANADSKRYAGTLNSKKIKTEKVIYNIYSIPVPTFTEVVYNIEMISNFQLQMNDMLSPFIKYSSNINGFKLIENNHAYECFMNEDIQDSSNLEDFSDQERELKYSFDLLLRGYLNVGGNNDKGPSVIRTENRPELVFKAEIIESGDLENL